MNANLHIRITSIRYQMDRQGIEQFWTQNKQEDIALSGRRILFVKHRRGTEQAPPFLKSVPQMLQT